MDDIYANINDLLKKPEDYLRPDTKLESGWKGHTRQIYNFMKQQESSHKFPAPPDALSRLNIEFLNSEQVWQLVELQNEPLLAAGDDMSSLGDANLCLDVARLCSLAKMGRLGIETSENDESLENSEEEMDGIEKDDELEDEEELSEEQSIDGDESDGEEMDLENEDNIDDIDLDTNFDNDTDDEVDNFDEFIAPEGYETDDSDHNHKVKEKVKYTKQREEKKESEIDSDASDPEKETKFKRNTDKQNPQEFKKTSVDTKFFRLRESEWVADNDAIGENYNGDSEDIDLMADISDGSEDEEGAMYNTFFDAPPDEEGNAAGKKLLSKLLSGDDDDDDEDDDNDEDEDEEETNIYDDEEENENQESITEKKQEEMQEVKMPLLGASKKEGKSRFELERERELAVMGQLEEENIGEKPWYLKGEAATAERPEDSALEQNLEYDIAARQKPVITEDTTSLVERIILGRVRSRAWDDVERRVKPNINLHEYKKTLLLDQDKSKKSLAEIYEQEYLKQNEEQKELGEDEILAHKMIKKKMKSLFRKLDALANFHFTPKLGGKDVKIKSNLPAITVEEATPDTTTNATLLAPQEVLEPSRGDLIGKTERTATDRKRERRTKKAQQKKKTKKQEKQLADKLKKAGKTGGKLDKDVSVRVIEKAVKAGHVKMLEGSQGKAVKSSQAFFKKFQDNQKSTKTLDNGGKKKKKKDNNSQSISKLLL